MNILHFNVPGPKLSFGSKLRGSVGRGRDERGRGAPWGMQLIKSVETSRASSMIFFKSTLKYI